MFLLCVLVYISFWCLVTADISLQTDDYKWKKFLYKNFGIKFQDIEITNEYDIESSWEEMYKFNMSFDLFEDITNRNPTIGLLSTRFLSRIPSTMFKIETIKNKFGKLNQNDCLHMDMNIFSAIDSTKIRVDEMDMFVSAFMAAFLEDGQNHCLYRLIGNTFTKYTNISSDIRAKDQNYIPSTFTVCGKYDPSTFTNTGHKMTQTAEWLKEIGKKIQVYRADSTSNELYYGNMPYFELFSQLPTNRAKAVAFLRSMGMNKDLLLHLTKNDVQSIFSEIVWMHSFEIYLRDISINLERGNILGNATIGASALPDGEIPTALDMYSFCFEAMDEFEANVIPTDIELFWNLAITKIQGIGDYAMEDIASSRSSTRSIGLSMIKSSLRDGIRATEILKNFHKFFAKISMNEWNKMLSSRYSIDTRSFSICNREKVKRSFLGPDILSEEIYDTISRADLQYVFSLMTVNDDISLRTLLNKLHSKTLKRSSNGASFFLQSKQPWINRLTPLLFHASLIPIIHYQPSNPENSSPIEKHFILISELLPQPQTIEEELESIGNDWTFLVLNYWRLGSTKLVKQFYTQYCTSHILEECIASMRFSDVPLLMQLLGFLSRVDIQMSNINGILQSFDHLMSYIQSNPRLHGIQNKLLIPLEHSTNSSHIPENIE